MATIDKDGRGAGTPEYVQVVVPYGELDVDNLEPLRKQLQMAAEKAPAVALDASRITFGDSSFLRVLLEIHQLTDLRIAAPLPVVDRLITMVGMDRVLRVFPTLGEAKAAPLSR